MKRLLAAGSGPIYQIGKAFRKSEQGERHNPEFTMVEWYRPGFDHQALMDEMDDFLQEVLGVGAAERETYGALFERHLGVNPHRASVSELSGAAEAVGEPPIRGRDVRVEDWLNLLMARVIEPKLGVKTPVFVYDYPRTLSALARIRPGDPPVAERFEVYLRGMELANGYHEITEADALRARFEKELARRRDLGRESVAVDERLLAAVDHGLPDGVSGLAGVALGLDRLVMIAAGARSIRDVLAFPFDSA